jgi:hypothetical protein
MATVSPSSAMEMCAARPTGTRVRPVPSTEI